MSHFKGKSNISKYELSSREKAVRPSGYQSNVEPLFQKAAPPEIAYTNPASYLTLLESSDGKINLIGLAVLVGGCWLLLRYVGQ